MIWRVFLYFWKNLPNQMFHMVMVWFDKFFLFFGKNSSNHNVPFLMSKNGNVVIWRVFFLLLRKHLDFPYAGNTIDKQKLNPNTVDGGPLHKQVKADKQTNKTNKSNKITNLTVGHFASSIELKPVLTIDVGFMREVSVCSSSKSAPYVIRVSVAPRYITWPKEGLKIWRGGEG